VGTVFAELLHEALLSEAGEIADRGESESVQDLERPRADSPELLQTERMEEGLDLPGSHDGPAAGLAEVRGDLGHELDRRDADGGREAGARPDLRGDLHGDLLGGAENPLGPGEIEKGLVERERLDERRVMGEHVHDLAGHGHVLAHVAGGGG
jgi:hypothetical protein